jgi:hypothetical protein
LSTQLTKFFVIFFQLATLSNERECALRRLTKSRTLLTSKLININGLQTFFKNILKRFMQFSTFCRLMGGERNGKKVPVIYLPEFIINSFL